MYNYQKKLKNQKQKTFHEIQTNYNYLFFCRYYDLKSVDSIAFKKFINNQSIQCTIIKQNLLPTTFQVKGQGSLIVFYFNDFLCLPLLYDFLMTSVKLEPLFVSIQKTFFSILKLQKILNPSLSPLPYQLTRPLFRVYQVLMNMH